MPRMNGREPTDSDWKKLKKETLRRILYLNRRRIHIYAPDGVKKGEFLAVQDWGDYSAVSLNGNIVQVNVPRTEPSGRKKIDRPAWEWPTDG